MLLLSLSALSYTVLSISRGGMEGASHTSLVGICVRMEVPHHSSAGRASTHHAERAA